LGDVQQRKATKIANKNREQLPYFNFLSLKKILQLDLLISFKRYLLFTGNFALDKGYLITYFHNLDLAAVGMIIQAYVEPR
jgi:hypothetical protein